MVPTYYLSFKTFEKGLQVGCLNIVFSTSRARGDRYWNVVFLQMMNQFMYAWQERNGWPEGFLHAATLLHICIQVEWDIRKE